jgi:hypothetical protein
VSPASAHIPSPHGLSIDRLREAIRAVERNIEQDLIQAAEYEIGHTEGGEHFDHHHEHAHMTGKAKSAADSATGVRRRHVRPAGVPLKSGKLDDASDSSSTDSTTLLVPEPTIRVSLTESQRRMVLWLNALNPTKFLAWYPDVPNAHAVIIVRDPVRFAAHERGRGVIRHWASMVTKAAAAH